MTKIFIVLFSFFFINIANASELQQIKNEIAEKSGITQYMKASVDSFEPILIQTADMLVQDVENSSGEKLTAEERNQIKKIIQKYNNKIIELVSVKKLIEVWIFEFGKNYSKEELIEINRSLDTKEGKKLFQAINNAHSRTMSYVSTVSMGEVEKLAAQMSNEILQIKN